jgi:hypothetical protein
MSRSGGNQRQLDPLAKFKQQRGLEGVALRQWASRKDNTKQNPAKADIQKANLVDT